MALFVPSHLIQKAGFLPYLQRSGEREQKGTSAPRKPGAGVGGEKQEEKREANKVGSNASIDRGLGYPEDPFQAAWLLETTHSPGSLEGW